MTGAIILTLEISTGPFIGLCITLHLPPPMIIIKWKLNNYQVDIQQMLNGNSIMKENIKLSHGCNFFSKCRILKND